VYSRLKLKKNQHVFHVKKNNVFGRQSNADLNNFSLQNFSKYNYNQTSNLLSLFNNSSFLKTFTVNSNKNVNLPYFLTALTKKNSPRSQQYLLTNYTSFLSNSSQFFKSQLLLFKPTFFLNSSFKNLKGFYLQPLKINVKLNSVTKFTNFFNKQALYVYFVKQSPRFRHNNDTSGQFFLDRSRNHVKNLFYLSTTTKSINLQGGCVLDVNFKNYSLNLTDLQSSVLNDNALENYLPLTKYFHSQNRLMIQKYTAALTRRRNYAKKLKRAVRRQKV